MVRENLEIGRQLIHLFVGIIIISMLLFLNKPFVLTFLLIIFLLSILLSILSIYLKIPFVSAILSNFEREHNQQFPGKGFIFFLAGAMLVIKLFSQDIALISIVVLTFGDSVSTLAGFFGGQYKRDPFNKYKSVYGTILGILVAFLIGMLFVNPVESFVASFFGMIAEAISIKLGEQEADDNLIVPLAAGTALYLFRLL